MRIKLDSIFSLFDTLGVSKVDRNILDEHIKWVGQPKKIRENRASGNFIWPNQLKTDDYVARWESYDEEYRNASRLNDFWLASLQHAVIHPPFGIVSVDDTIISETVRDSKMLSATFPGLDRDVARKAIKKPGTMFDVFDWDSEESIEESSFLLGWGLHSNYFNWTLRFLSKLPQFISGCPESTLLIPYPVMPFISGSLNTLGIKRFRLLSQRVKCKDLAISAPSAFGRYELSYLLPEALHDKIGVVLHAQEGSEKVYIPRRNTKIRSVVNEDHVIEMLADRGFNIFDCAAHSFEEQVQTFRRASMVIGPHGAGLTNIAYCQPGSSVVELVPEGYDQGVTSYRSLADLCGHAYVQIAAKEAAPDSKGNPCNSDIYVDLETLSAELDKRA